jgi:hypothetical protein
LSIAFEQKEANNNQEQKLPAKIRNGGRDGQTKDHASNNQQPKKKKWCSHRKIYTYNTVDCWVKDPSKQPKRNNDGKNPQQRRYPRYLSNFLHAEKGKKEKRSAKSVSSSTIQTSQMILVHISVKDLPIREVIRNM